MFGHHFHHSAEDRRGCGPREGHFRQGFGRFGGGHGPFGRGFGGGGGRERMFDQGEFQLVLLHLLAEKPSYGYELIKTLEERLAGGYTPSPGVVYPTLTLLEEGGFTSASTAEGGRKVYTITPAGLEHLQANQKRVGEILERLKETGEEFERGRSPEFRRAFKDLQRAILGVAMRGRSARGLTPEQVRKITEAIEAATRAIDEL